MPPALRRTFWYRHIPFFLVLILAIAVRFIWLQDRPYDSDELGALFRAENAHTFNAHIQTGVTIDGHPALVQTFLWINAQMGILSPLHLKMLWGIMSLLGISLFYAFFWMRMGRKTAFFVFSSLALLWWPVSMGIWVRPYSIAFFWLGLLAFSSERFYRKKAKNTLWAALMAISLALLAYTHYMAALTGVLFLASELWMRRLTRSQFLAIGVGAAILYAPHFGIFISQLKEGGLSWLGKPQYDFLFAHVYYILNQSNLVSIWLTLFLVTGAIFSYKKGLSTNLIQKSMALGGIWVLVFLISYVYSLVQKPVLQHNALFFALPFLLGGISVLFQKMPVSVLRFFNFLWVAILFFSLSKEKGYFTTAFEDRYASPIKAISSMESKNNMADLTLLDGPTDVLNFHLNTHPIKSVWLLENFKKDKITPLNSIFRISDSSKVFWIGLHAGSDINLQTYFWSRLGLIPSASNGVERNFITGGEYYSATVSDSSFLESHKSMIKMLPMKEGLFIDFKEIEAQLGAIERNDILMISVEDGFACNEVFREFHLVTAIFQEGFNRALNQIDYRFTPNTSRMNQFKDWLHHPIKLADIPNWDTKSRLRVSYEYRGPEDMKFQRAPIQLRIRKIKGNPHLYSRKTLQTIGS
jgi:hypothetical protein